MLILLLVLLSYLCLSSSVHGVVPSILVGEVEGDCRPQLVFDREDLRRTYREIYIIILQVIVTGRAQGNTFVISIYLSCPLAVFQLYLPLLYLNN